MKILIRTAVFFSLLLLVLSCASRYKYELYQIADDIRRKVKVEATQFVPNAVLGDPNSLEKFVPGTGNTIIVTTGTRGLTHEADTYSVMRFDEYLRCDVYFEVSNPLKVETVPLVDNSYLWIRGRYDQAAGSKLFMPESGELSIDSLRGDHLFGTLRGVFQNSDKVPLSFDGHFKAKFRK